ncbi:AfsR/SARP family transcriptional regulator [Streptacidiphilus cavernicola]|uniref:BTAD domain-containing putative transcriptional regulator n=1 Tax=Streptacidiphilus cavernicola TaxID=3342716 RepID=A0ABV6VPC8_9ACTN
MDKTEEDQAGPPLEFQLLGPVQARLDGARLELGSPQQLAVLARLLLAAGRVVPIQDLVDGIWGESSPPRAVGTVRTYVSRLRALLDPGRAARGRDEVLLSVGDGYTLRIPEGSLDLTAFLRLRARAAEQRGAGDQAAAGALLDRALAMWSGEPLAGVPGGFAERERDRIAALRFDTVEEKAAADLALGLHGQALALLGPLVAEQPMRERPRAQLMLALYRGGRQAEALGVYADTRRLLVAELGVEPGSELAALHQRILAADPDLDLAPPPSGPDDTAAAVVRPSQLPSDIPDFIGRADTVDYLLRALTEAQQGSAVGVHALSGLGGVGKTTLAVHVAHRARESFPDGQLYADLNGTQSVPADPADVLAQFLTALGTAPDQLPERLDQRSSLLRSLLADRSVLMLLDNARDADQVRPLLPGTSGNAVLVTSRTRPAELPGVRLLDVGALEQDEAVSLLAAVAGPGRIADEEPAARALVNACALLPLAVRIVAARLAARPSWTVGSLLARLEDQRRRLDELRVGSLAVEATFQLGYQQLTERQARAFRLLALPDGPSLPVLGAATVLGGREREAEELAESLVDAGLLEADGAGRYRYHDLLRLFARSRAEAEDGAELCGGVPLVLLERLLERVCDAWRTLIGDQTLTWRLHPGTSGTAGQGVLSGTGGLGSGQAPGLAPGFADEDSAWGWLRAERQLVPAVAEQVLRHTPAQGLRAVVDLLIGWIWLFENEAAAQGFAPVLAFALDTAREQDDPRSTGRLAYLTGLLAALAGRTAEAEQHLRDALELLETDDNLEIRYTAAAELALTLNSSGRPEQALPYLELARRLSAELGHLADEARLLGNIARAHLTAGRSAEAVRAAESAFAIAQTSGNRGCLADAVYQLGIAQQGSGEPAAAAERFLEAVGLFRAQQRPSLEGPALARLADCRTDLGSPAAAVVLAEQALDLGSTHDLRYCQALGQAALGRALLMLGQEYRAGGCLAEALRIYEELNSPEAAGVRVLLAGTGAGRESGAGAVAGADQGGRLTSLIGY